jgi:hypothetical protein
VTDGLPPYPSSQDSGRLQQPAGGTTVALLCLAICLVFGALAAMLELGQTAQSSALDDGPAVEYDSDFDFADSVPSADRQWIVQAIAHARPEAVRLIELVDDRTAVSASADGSNLGLTWAPTDQGWNRIGLDLPRLDTSVRVDRELVLLHELGHVIDHQLVPGSLRNRLVAGVPRTGSCRNGNLGDCAPPQEKFADTFAAWAYRGAVAYRSGSGYHLRVPRDIEAWGAPLIELAERSAPGARER